MNTTNSNLQALQNQLPDLAWITDPARVARLSQDFYWFSPVLKALLDGKVAEAVVRPRNEDELRALVGGCVTHRVPITLRGGGTGNYGQSTPLRGGVVVDMGDFKQVCWIRDGAGRAQAGIRLGDFDNQARDLGWEMRCIPSTFRIASLGGFFGGGLGQQRHIIKNGGDVVEQCKQLGATGEVAGKPWWVRMSGRDQPTALMGAPQRAPAFSSIAIISR